MNIIFKDSKGRPVAKMDSNNPVSRRKEKNCEHQSCSYAPKGKYKCNSCAAILTQGDIESMEGAYW